MTVQNGVFEQSYMIEALETIRSKDWDYIVVTAFFSEILNQLVTEYHIDENKIIKARQLIIPGKSNLGSIRLDCDYDDVYNVNDLMPDKIIASNQLEEFFFHKQHRATNKFWHYFEIYETFFNKYKGSDVKFLEIGVNKGGSMQMWKDYFGEKATIVGIDIDKNCKTFEEDNVHIRIGSQADKDFLIKVSEELGPFDIILDDGSHVMEHQIITFETLFPLLKDGGVFLCEDCLTSYLPRYGGGYKKEDTFIEYSKNFVDYINSQSVNFKDKDNFPPYADYVKACYYYDCMVVVEKKYRGYSFYTKFSQ